MAVNPSDAERARLARASAALRDAGFPVRWVPPENVHMTLKFLGEVPEERMGEVTAAVDGAVAGAAPFEARVGGFGAFPSLRRPQVIWVGLEPTDALGALQASLEEALASLGFPREERAFHPHLTLGRARRRASPREFRGLEDLIERLEYNDTFEFGAVDVMRSRLMPSGALYDVVHSSLLEA